MRHVLVVWVKRHLWVDTNNYVNGYSKISKLDIVWAGWQNIIDSMRLTLKDGAVD